MPSTVRKYYQDPGHGWIAVPLSDLEELGIGYLISSYSYIGPNRTVYLEEDSDAPIYLRAMKSAGCEVELQIVYQEYTPIRDFRPFETWMVS